MHYKTEILQSNLYAFAEIQNPKMMPKIQWCLCRHVSADAPTSLIFAFTEIQNPKKMHKIQCPLGVGSHLEYHFCHPLDTGVRREPLVPGGDLLCTPWNRPFLGCGGWGLVGHLASLGAICLHNVLSVSLCIHCPIVFRASDPLEVARNRPPNGKDDVCSNSYRGTSNFLIADCKTKGKSNCMISVDYKT